MAREQDKSAGALDSFDRAILRLVQADNKMPQRRIGEAVNLSAAAVQRRIAAMEDAGVIARNVAIVDPDTVPLTITSIVEVQLINEHAPTVELARRMFLDTPEVQQCYYVTGGVSFMLVIVTSDMRAYSALTKRLFAEKAFIASYRSLIALDRVKADTSIIIP